MPLLVAIVDGMADRRWEMWDEDHEVVIYHVQVELEHDHRVKWWQIN
jgi:hypothetical protein